jgi:hypothetical protein
MYIMEIALLVLLLALVGLGISKLQHPRFETILFLRIEPRETNADGSPRKSILMQKFLRLAAPPLPGMELDEQGTPRYLKIARTTVSERGIVVYFDTLKVPVSGFDEYVKDLAKNCKWELVLSGSDFGPSS